ncbi:MAG: transposase [Candidatus Obscuribacterales bacterium]|nr:transposase [Candidatus Obscuribacterales bacterium]
MKKRRSIRIPGFDYSQAGAYYITICTYNRTHLFGEIDGPEIQLNELGQLVKTCLNNLSNDYPFVSLDDFVVMPNHLHGIVWLESNNPSKKPLSRILAAFKAKTTSHARTLGHDQLWQRNFFEHVIRDEEDLFRIREYIATNAVSWSLDQETWSQWMTYQKTNV